MDVSLAVGKCMIHIHTSSRSIRSEKNSCSDTSVISLRICICLSVMRVNSKRDPHFSNLLPLFLSLEIRSCYPNEMLRRGTVVIIDKQSYGPRGTSRRVVIYAEARQS